MAKAAIIITCFNEARFVRHAVDCALRQTVPAQVIVVDDGSTDGSDALLADLDIDFVRITNRGQPAARTAGILSLRDDIDWVIFADGDDGLANNYVEEMLKHTDEGDLIFSRIMREGSEATEGVLKRHPTVAELWQVFPGFGTFMVRRELLKAMGGFHPLVAGEQDWDFALEARMRGAEFAYCDTTHFWYRYNPSGYSKGDGRTARLDILREMRRHLPVGPFGPKKDAHQEYLDGGSPEYLHQARL